jgi:hypothetical protein
MFSTDTEKSLGKAVAATVSAAAFWAALEKKEGPDIPSADVVAPSTRGRSTLQP